MNYKLAIFLPFCAILFLSGCSPAGKLKRAEKLIAKAEEAGAKWSVDTVFVTKEVIVPERHIDTVLNYRNLNDTITVIQDKVVTKVKYNTVDKTIYVHTDCKSDTVRIEVPTIVTKKISAGYGWWYVIKWCILVAVVSALLSRIIWK